VRWEECDPVQPGGSCGAASTTLGAADHVFQLGSVTSAAPDDGTATHTLEVSGLASGDYVGCWKSVDGNWSGGDAAHLAVQVAYLRVAGPSENGFSPAVCTLGRPCTLTLTSSIPSLPLPEGELALRLSAGCSSTPVAAGYGYLEGETVTDTAAGMAMYSSFQDARDACDATAACKGIWYVDPASTGGAVLYYNLDVTGTGTYTGLDPKQK
jgi:hypothetical protein